MKMFHWERMESLGRVGSGDLIVMAEDLETARSIARDNLWHYMKTNPSFPRYYLFELYGDFENFDEDDKETINEFVEEFNLDISKRPTERVQRPIVFLLGTE